MMRKSCIGWALAGVVVVISVFATFGVVLSPAPAGPKSTEPSADQGVAVLGTDAMTRGLAALRSGGAAPVPAVDSGTPRAASGDPSVLATLVLSNNTVVPGNFLAANPQGNSPYAIAYDSGKGELFVTNGNASEIEVISDATNRVVHTIPEPYGAYAVAYDSHRGEVFVANFGSNNVSVISDTSDKVTATIRVGSNPYSLAYDSAKHEVFVTNYGSNNVSVISDSQNAVVATIPVGSVPNGIAYDSGKGELFVVDHNGYPTSTVNVISDSSDSVVANVTVGADPVGVAYDSGKGEVFVTNGPAQPSDTVSVISDKSNSVVATVTVGDEPLSAAYDPVAKEVLVPNSCGHATAPPAPCTGSVSVISDASNSVIATVPTGEGPWGIAYDRGDGLDYICDAAQGTISVVTVGPTDHVATRTYAGTSSIYALASNRTVALVNLYYDNATNGLVLFNASSNSSKVIQAEVPGGNATADVSLISAGGAFFIAWENTSSQRYYWNKVSLSGKITDVNLPLSTGRAWVFDYGNGTSLYASSGKFLVEINAASLTLEANYTKLLPTNVSVNSVLPVGNRLYLAGSRALSSGATNAYFGFLNLSSMKVTTVSKTVSTYPADLKGAFFTFLEFGENVYVGGSLAIAIPQPLYLQTVTGLFYSYTPSTSSFRNLSSMLPVQSWGVFALEPWAKTVALSLNGYTIRVSTGTYTLGGGIYTLSSSGTGLVNQTANFPAGYVPDILDETNVSGGWFFSGGTGTAGTGETVAVKT